MSRRLIALLALVACFAVPTVTLMDDCDDGEDCRSCALCLCCPQGVSTAMAPARLAEPPALAGRHPEEVASTGPAPIPRGILHVPLASVV